MCRTNNVSDQKYNINSQILEKIETKYGMIIFYLDVALWAS